METLRENIGHTQKRGWNSLKLTNKIFETCVLVQFHHFVVNRDVLSTFLLITWNCKWLQITKSPGLVLSVSIIKYCVIFFSAGYKFTWCGSLRLDDVAVDVTVFLLTCRQLHSFVLAKPGHTLILGISGMNNGKK